MHFLADKALTPSLADMSAKIVSSGGGGGINAFVARLESEKQFISKPKLNCVPPKKYSDHVRQYYVIHICVLNSWYIYICAI